MVLRHSDGCFPVTISAKGEGEIVGGNGKGVTCGRMLECPCLQLGLRQVFAVHGTAARSRVRVARTLVLLALALVALLLELLVAALLLELVVVAA